MKDIQTLKEETIVERIPVFNALRLLATGFLAGKDRLHPAHIEGVHPNPEEWTMDDVLLVESHYRKTGLAKSPDGRAFLDEFEKLKAIITRVGPDADINARQFSAEIAAIQGDARQDCSSALSSVAEHFAAEAALQTFRRLDLDPMDAQNEESLRREDLLDEVIQHVRDQILLGN